MVYLLILLFHLLYLDAVTPFIMGMIIAIIMTIIIMGIIALNMLVQSVV